MAAVLRLHNVTKTYSNGRGIHNVSFQINPGEIFGFLGPNGAGKTTTIRCIMDFIRPQEGTISVSGHDAQNESALVKQLIGYLPAESQLYEHWTGAEHVAFYANTRKTAKPAELASRLGLDLTMQVRNLSTGNRQKLAFLLAVMGKPKLLILDEPTKGLDPLLQQEIYDILKEYSQAGGSVFISSHNLPEVEKICHKVGVIKDGSIVAHESMERIRAMSIHNITLTSGKRINIKDFSDSNITIVHQSDKHLLLRVKGSVQETIEAASKYPIKDIEITHANLEDIFMEYYR